MPTIRSPAVAGMFYPDDAKILHHQIQDLLTSVTVVDPPPKAMIVPHAGYVYSGPIAASAYARLHSLRDIIRRVILVGPSHRVGFRGVAVSAMKTFDTPLGQIPLDRDAIDQICSLPQVMVLEKAHAQEHSLEVQLPFLQETLNHFRLVPLVVGEASPEAVGEILEILWGGRETLLVISSDLSHYHNYPQAQRMDAVTSRAIEELRWQDIGYQDACGGGPIKGLLWTARRKKLQVKTIDLRNSGDTAGPRDRVVGYGSYVFTE